MTELIRHVIGRLTGRTAKNKYPVAHIEGADNVMLDSSVLCCPVCYNLYDSAPSVLQCGHTFCTKCLRNIAGLRIISRQGDGRSFPCPLCRQPCIFENVVKNYIIEDILNRLEKLPEEDEFRDKLILANLRIAKQRVEQRCADSELSNNRLAAEIKERRKKEMRNYASILFCFVSYLLLAHVYFEWELHYTSTCTTTVVSIRDPLLRGIMSIYQYGRLFLGHFFV